MNNCEERTFVRELSMLPRFTTALLATTALIGIITSSPAQANDYVVSSTADDGSPGTLRYAINQSNAVGGSNTITFNAGLGTIQLLSNLPLVASSVTINANGATLDGASTYRGFLISGVSTTGMAAAPTTVLISNLNIQNVIAQGGNGGTGGGGGGLGAGGAVFVGPAANVTLTNVGVANARAVGGVGGTAAVTVVNGNSYAANEGGGGGLGGNGGAVNTNRPAGSGGGGILFAGGVGNNGLAQGDTGSGGGGGGGITSAGGNSVANGNGGTGGSGGLGQPSSGNTTLGGGGGGAGSSGNGGSGAGGAAGGSGAAAGAGQGVGGAGGFGGGGGGGFAGSGGTAGFGGGGGGGSSIGGGGGNGGFGGGGGGSGQISATGGSGGFGGGGGIGTDGNFNAGNLGASGFGASAATNAQGGSGAGLGGAIFVTAGGTLIINGATTGTSTESGGVATQGSTTGNTGFGSGIFYQATKNATTNLTFGVGNTTIGDTIADYIGSGGTNPLVNGNPNAANQGGSLTLSKTGTGTLILSGANTYSGGTTFGGGTINVGSAGALGTPVMARDLSFTGGALQYSAANQVDYSGRFSTAAGQLYSVDTNGQNVTYATALSSLGGSLTKLGTGTLTLTAANTYSGGTAVNAGTLALGTGGSLLAGSNLTVTGGTFQYNATNQNLGTVSMSSGAINATAGNQSVAALVGTGGTLNSMGRTFTITNASGNFGGVITSGSVAITGGSQGFSGANTYGFGTALSGGATLTLSGAGTIGAGSGSTTISGGSKLDLGGTSQTQNMVTLTGGTLTNGALAAAVTALSGNNAFSGLAGTMSLTNAGGTGTISGTNTYSGATVVSGGTLTTSNANAFSAASSTTVTGGTLDLGGFNQTIGSLGGTGMVTSSGMAAVTLTVGSNNGTDAFSGPIGNGSGTVGLIKVGSGVQTLSGTNSYTGGTTVNGGLLRIGVDGGAQGTVVGTFVNNANLDFTTANVAGVTSITTNASGLTQFYGPLTGLSATITNAGTTTFRRTTSAGTAAITNTAGTTNFIANSTGGQATFNVTGGTIDFSQTTGLAGDGQITAGSIAGTAAGRYPIGANTLTTGSTNASTEVAGVISGTGGSLVKVGSGTLTLSGINTFSGMTTVSAGTLAIASTGSLAASVTNNATFTNAGTVMGPLTNTGTATNAGTLASVVNSGTFSNANAVSGTLNNTGTASNSGTISGAVTNSNEFDNLMGGVVTGQVTTTNGTTSNIGTMNGGATLTGGTLATTGTVNGGVTNTGGTVAAEGGAINGPVANNAGTFAVSGAVSSNATFANANGANLSVSNGGSYTLQGLLTNAGVTAVAAGGTLIATAGGITNTASGSITNNGTIRDDLNNAGMVTNNGTYVANVASNSGSIANTATGAWTGNVASNTGTIGNAGVWTGNVLSNTGTIANTRTWTGSIATSGNFSNATGATVSGLVSNSGTVTNAGALNGGLTQTAGTTTNTGTIGGTTTVSGGTLTGAGTLATLNVNNGGTFVAGNGTPGSVTAITGNLAFQSGAVYQVGINPTTAASTNVAGTATLGNAAVQAFFASGTYVNRQYTIVNAAGGVVGNFASVASTNLPSGFNATLGTDATHAYLNLALNYTPPPSPGQTAPVNNGLNQNQRAVGAAIVNAFNTNGTVPIAFGALTPAGLTQASGEVATATQQATFDAMGLFMGVMTDPFTGNRGETAQPGGAVGSADDALGYAAKRGSSDAKSSDAMAAIYRKAPPLIAAPLQRWSVWSAGFGGSQTTDGNAVVGSNTATSRIYGGAVGLDYRLSPYTLAGVALAGGGTNFSVANSGTGRSDLFQAGAFIRHTAGATYLTAALAYGWQDVTTDRSIGIDRLNARFITDAFSGRIEGGYRVVAPVMGLGLGLTPYAAGQVTTLYLPDDRETAGATNTFGLAYAARDVTATRSELGVRSDTSFAAFDGLMTLRGRAAWAHNFDPDRSISATFQSLPGATFVVNGAAQAREAALVTASAEMKWRSGWAVAATFEGEFSNVTRSYAGKGVLRYGW